MKSLISILICLVLSLVSNGQEKINLENLKAPSSPASTILGIQPSEITRPKSVKDLEATLFNNFTDNYSLSIPNDYGLEVMPYWIFNNKNIDQLGYLKNTGFKSGWSTLSISVASVISKTLAMVSTNVLRSLEKIVTRLREASFLWKSL